MQSRDSFGLSFLHTSTFLQAMPACLRVNHRPAHLICPYLPVSTHINPYHTQDPACLVENPDTGQINLFGTLFSM